MPAATLASRSMFCCAASINDGGLRGVSVHPHELCGNRQPCLPNAGADEGGSERNVIHRVNASGSSAVNCR
jgi:hypothetical protein